MKISLLVLCFFSSACFSQVVGIRLTKAPVLIFIAGEANATGGGYNDSLQLSEIGLRNSTQYFDTTAMIFSTLNQVAGGRSGFENGIANCADSGKFGPGPVHVLRAGLSGTTIRNWQNLTASPAWTNFTRFADSAVKIMTNQYGVPPAIYLMWSQGVNDSTGGELPDIWRDSTKSFLKQIRNRYGKMPILITELPAAYDVFNAQIYTLPAQVEQLYVIPARLSKITWGEYRHWDVDGLREIASRMVQIMISNYKLF